MNHSGAVVALLLIGVVANARAMSVTQDCTGTTFFVAAVAVAGSAVYDIATAPASARQYNQRNLSVVPHVDLARRSYGLRASWSFGRSSRASTRPAPAPVRKSPTTAFVLSFASTAAPMAVGVGIQNVGGADLFLAGLIVGPSVGHVYAGRPVRGLATAILRGAGTLAGLTSIIPCFD